VSDAPPEAPVTDDRTPGPLPLATAPEPLPLPVSPQAIPIPVDARSRSRWPRRVAIGGIAVLVLVVIAACVAVSVYSGRFLNDLAGFGQTSFASGPSVATWSGDGEWIFTQSSDAMGSTSVTAVRPSDGTTKTLEGYWLVAVEPTGSRARLVEDPGTAPLDLIGRASVEPSAVLEALDASVVTPGSYSDVPGADSLVWDPSLMEQPGASDWAAETMPDGRVASFRIDPTHGIYPCAIDLSGNGVDFEVESTGTMQPIGWSSSGRYYATLTLVVAKDLESDELVDRTVTLDVWDVAGRCEVASATFTPGFATQIVWSPVEDVLYWSQQGTGSEPPNVVRMLRPGKPSRTLALPSEVVSAAPVVVGTDDRGVMLRLLIADEDTSTPNAPSSADDGSSAGSGPRRHVRIIKGGHVEAAGSDMVAAVFSEVHPSGTLWWHPTIPRENVTAAPSATGINLWWARSLDAPAIHLLDIEVEDQTATK